MADHINSTEPKRIGQQKKIEKLAKKILVARKTTVASNKIKQLVKPESKQIKDDNVIAAMPEASNDVEQAIVRELSVGEVRESYLLPGGYFHPRYPTSARRRNIQGKVILEIIVKRGNLEHQKVFRSSGNLALDMSAQRAVKQWRFKPDVNLSRYRLSIAYAIQ